MTINLETITLEHGSHQSREAGMCAMEAVAWLAGEPHSDHPACACPVVGAYVMNLNDTLPTDQRQRLKAYLPRIVGSKGTLALETKRAYLAADMSVRVFAVAALNSAGLSEEAGKLAALAPLVDRETARAAVYAAYAAADAVYAAADAADAADAVYAARAAADAAYAAADAVYATYAARAAVYAARAAADAVYAADAADAVYAADPYAAAFGGLEKLLACVE